MIPSLKRGCQLRWDLLFDGEMVPSARGVDTLAAMGTLRLQLCRRPSDKYLESAGFQTGGCRWVIGRACRLGQHY